MAKHSIDELAIQISASTAGLPGDLRRAQAMFGKFQKDINAMGSVAPSVDTTAFRRAEKDARAFGLASRAMSSAAAAPFFAAAAAAEKLKATLKNPLGEFKSSMNGTGEAARGMFARIGQAGRDTLSKLTQDAKAVARAMADPLGTAASGLRAAGRRIEGGHGDITTAAVAGLVAGKTSRGGVAAHTKPAAEPHAPPAPAAPTLAPPTTDPMADIASNQARIDAATKAEMDRYDRRSKAKAKANAKARAKEHTPGVDIPEDLSAVGYRDLQGLAKQLGIPAKQKLDPLRQQIEAARADPAAASVAGREANFARKRERAREKVLAKVMAKEAGALEAAFDAMIPAGSRAGVASRLGITAPAKGLAGLADLLTSKPTKQSAAGPIQTIDEIGRKARVKPAPVAAAPSKPAPENTPPPDTARGWGSVIKTAAVVGGTAAAISQIRDAVNSAADFEQTTLAFEVMLGSAQKADKMLSEIRQFAASTPFNTKELTASARMLVAYGTSAGQVIPTLRMLGDVSAAMGKDLPIERLTYLYGTLQTQGQAYTRDLNQFTIAGVDVLPDLAKQFGVTTGEVKKLVEEGRVGFPDFVKVFKAMTSEGGRFHDMTRRQSQTFAGIRESAFDAFALFKQKLGTAIIEQTGLKEAAKDFEAFSKMLESQIDKAKPFIKFMGDLTKAAVQVGYEFGRAGVAIAQIFGQQAAAAFPGLARLPEAIRDMSNMKVNRVALFDVVSGIGEVLITGIGWMVDGVEAFGKAFQDTAKSIQKTMAELSLASVMANPANYANGKVLAAQVAYAMMPGNKPPPTGLGGGLQDTTAQHLSMAAARQASAEYGAAAIRKFGPDVPQAVQIREMLNQYNLANKFEGDNAKIQDILLGGKDDQLATLRLKGAPPIAAPTDPQKAKPWFDREGYKAQRGEMRANLVAGELADQQEKVTAEAKKSADALAAFTDAVKASSAGATGWNAIAMGAGKHEASYGGVNAGIFRWAIDQARSANTVRDPEGPSPVLYEFANNIKDELDPMRKLLQDKKLLDDSANFGLLTADQRDAAWTRKVRGVAGHLGVGGPTQLADAVTVGSQEDARLLARHSVGDGPQKTEDLLRMIYEAVERGNKANADAARSAPRLGGWLF